MGKFRDLTGQRFGMLTAIKIVGEYTEPKTSRKRAKWLCSCDCGEETVVAENNLMGKNGTKSCGCLRRNFAYNLNKKLNTYNLSGDYGIGYTSKGEEFYFDLEDYDKIKNYGWYINNRGYVCAKNNNEQILFHRLVLNIKDNEEIDHIHGGKSKRDNRKSNLRPCAHSENMLNIGLKSNNTSGVTGVNWNKRANKWDVRVTINGVRKFLGRYKDFEVAKKVRKEAENKYYGEFSYDNSQSYNTK